MGSMKNMAREMDDYYQKAKDILLELNEISLCKYHPDEMFFYRKQRILDETTYAVATDRFKVKYPNDKNYKKFHAQLKKVLNDAALSQEDCPICRRIKED